VKASEEDSIPLWWVWRYLSP